ncbi:hypothetical protein HC928_24180 [bacterium]|nr:hypothetical protein [bacterium]
MLRQVSNTGHVTLSPMHPVVEKTRHIRDRIARRVENTLKVREWEYVNYGFLLKGLAMDRELDRPGINVDDQWRSHWIDCLVREHILERQLVPHRHNPDDLVPVIKLCDETPFSSNLMIDDAEKSGYYANANSNNNSSGPTSDDAVQSWAGITLEALEQLEPETADMARRILVSIEQFTSFRNFAWCPLGSLHRRLRAFDTGMTFQRAVEYLVENKAARIDEYPNPQSDYNTKGISIDRRSRIARRILKERDAFIGLLLDLYDSNLLISGQSVQNLDPDVPWDIDLWFSIMETENVLNALPGRSGQFSLFRTHHTVNLVAEKREQTQGAAPSTGDQANDNEPENNA